jgi:glycosyltransferase involved in cell wall biosynthesis
MMVDQLHTVVTVVIPCFNQARFLPMAIASVRTQRYPHLECIVVNDGSTDDTAAVADRLGVAVVDQPNQGVSAARNTGLRAAHGELIVFLDADDELLPDAIAIGAKALLSEPTAAAIVGRCQVMDSGGGDLPAFHSPVDASNLYEEWLSKNFVWTPGAAMFRRRSLEEIGGFPADLGPAGDYAVYLRLARHNRVRRIEMDLVRYRQHQTSMSRDPSLMLRATLMVLRRERRDAPKSLHLALKLGRRRWCEWYGQQIVSRLAADWRARKIGWSQARAVATLLRYCPSIALGHLTGKAVLVVTPVRRLAAAIVRQRPETPKRKAAR